MNADWGQSDNPLLGRGKLHTTNSVRTEWTLTARQFPSQTRRTPEAGKIFWSTSVHQPDAVQAGIGGASGREVDF
jgi:hypothetical protein